MYKLGMDHNLPRRWDHMPTLDLEQTCATLPHRQLQGQLNLEGFDEINRPKPNKLLEGYVQPPNVAKGDAWIADKKRQKKVPKSALKINPLESDDEDPASPSGAAAGPSGTTSAVGTPLTVRGTKRPRASTTTTPRAATTPQTTTSSSPATAPATPTTQFRKTKKVGDYRYRGPANATVTTGEIDDDRGNPFITGNDPEACKKYHQDLYDTLDPSTKGAYGKMLPLVRQQQMTVESDPSVDNQTQFPFAAEWLIWKPMGVREKASAATAASPGGGRGGRGGSGGKGRKGRKGATGPGTRGSRGS